MKRFVLAALLLTTQAAAQQAPWYGGASTGTAYPNFSTPVVASASGTTIAPTATLPGVAGKTTFMCGFAATSYGTNNTNGFVQINGIIGGNTMYFAYVIPATGQGQLVVPFRPCLPANAANTAITIQIPAAGAGGSSTVNAWGYQSGT